MNVSWLAGFFDGEGCVRLERSHDSNRFYARLMITQKDLGVLRKIQAEYGGKIRPLSTNSCSNICWHGHEAVVLAQRLLPHSVCKHDQLLVLIESADVLSTERENYSDLLSALKKNIITA